MVSAEDVAVVASESAVCCNEEFSAVVVAVVAALSESVLPDDLTGVLMTMTLPLLAVEVLIADKGTAALSGDCDIWAELLVLLSTTTSPSLLVKVTCSEVFSASEY